MADYIKYIEETATLEMERELQKNITAQADDTDSNILKRTQFTTIQLTNRIKSECTESKPLSAKSILSSAVFGVSVIGLMSI